MNTHLLSGKASRHFVSLSCLLTGETQLSETLADRYWERLHALFGDDLLRLVAEWQKIEGKGGEHKSLQDLLAGDKVLARTAFGILQAWYTGDIRTAGEIPDGPWSPGEYADGLLWKVIRAHAPGFTNAGFGEWAKPPGKASPANPQNGTDAGVSGSGTPKVQYDVIVVGSGVAGALVAYQLKTFKPKLSIAVIDAGDNGISSADRERYRHVYALTTDRDSVSAYKRLTSTTKVPIPGAGVDRTHLLQAGPDDFKSNYGRLLGGST